MKTYFVSLFSLMFFLSGCATAPMSTPLSVGDATQVPVAATPTVPTATVTLSPSPAVTPPVPTPTFISASLPNDLIVAYVVDDALWIWKQGISQLLLQRQNISTPLFSDDGQWILFRQRHISFDELWVVRTDGSELQRLVGADDLKVLTGKNVSSLIADVNWLPDSHKILFNTEKIIEGPPGSWPLFDLYSLDMSGQVTQLVEAGSGGKFIVSPTGTYVALVTDSKIDVLDLESGGHRTLLEFEPVGFPSDSGPTVPKVVWDPDGRFVMTSILPQNLYYPDKYAGEFTQIWRLFVNGQTELIAELQPFIPGPGIVYSPDLQYFFYLNNSCTDGMGMLYVHSIKSEEEYPLSCVWELPQWTPDGEYFIYQLDWLWQLGSILDNANQPLDVLNVPDDTDIHVSSQLTWINDEYFLLFLRNRDICTLNVAALKGMVAEIASTPSDTCPWMVDFSLSK